MSFVIEWRTRKLDDSQKEGLEGEIKNKIGRNIEQLIQKIVLYDDEQGNSISTKTNWRAITSQKEIFC